MADSISQVAARMRRFEKTLQGRIENQEVALMRIFLGAEKKLFAERSAILSRLAIGENGKLLQDNENLARVESIIEQVDGIVQQELVTPGRDWADAALPEALKDGRSLARINFNLIDTRLVQEAFRQVSVAEAGVLRVGIQDAYEIMGTTGADIAEFFRRELTESVLLGRPVQGPGSLAERLFESNRLKPLKIRTQENKIITRSIRQRAVGIARIETAKIVNRAHQIKTEEIYEQLGEEEPVYVNINPQDSRTTDICMRASKQPPMTIEEWDRSEFGRPPRLNPFHYCRSLLMAGTRRMFKVEGYRTDA